jgi:hypothetical protein
MSITQNALTGEAQVDQILGVVTSDNVGSISIGAGSTSTTTFSTGIPDTCLFEGRFKLQSVGVWTPLSGKSLTGSGTTLLARGVIVIVRVESGNVSVYVNSSSLSTEVVDFEIVLIAKTNQAPITPQTFISDNSFDSDLNYLKIATQDVDPVTVASSPFSAPFFTKTTHPITHGLGVIPMVKFWLEYSGKIVKCDTYAGFMTSTNIGGFPRITTSGVDIDFFNNSVAGASPSYSIQLHYRIYYDN